MLNKLINQLDLLYPNVGPGLYHESDFQFLIAVILSPQASDERVNSVSKKLFAIYPNAKLLATADKTEVIKILTPLGLQKVKTDNIIKAATAVNLLGAIPTDLTLLKAIPGIGEKCAKLYLGEKANLKYFPVDSHIQRIFFRFFAKSAKDFTNKIETETNNPMKLHYQLLKFGRQICKSYNPHCLKCPLQLSCNFAKEKYHNYIH